MFATILGTVTQAEAQGANLAQGRSASQSSTAFNGVASRAVDGNTNGNYQNNSVTHTNTELDPWWQVDLGSNTGVGSVSLFNRTDCCPDRLTNFYVFVSATDLTGRALSDIVADSSVARTHYTGTVGTSAQISFNASGRYVRVHKVGNGVLSLAEVEIYAPQVGDAFVINPGDQFSKVGDNIRLPISYGGNIDVVGLPNGWSFTNGEIVGTAATVGRWPIELRVSGQNGNDVAFFQWVVTDGAPGGVVAEHPPVDPRTLSMRPMEGHDGVVWDRYNDDTTRSLDITVWDMQQLGDWMYVGGEFKQVQENNGTTHNQRHLARFSIRTGKWDPTFRPQLDGNVHAMEVSPRGRLIVGGEFTNIDGLPNTQALAAFREDGTVDPSFEAWVERPWYPEGRAIIRELEVVGNFLYIGGNFSHINGPGGTRVRVNKLTRVGANYGTIDPSWNPVVSGGSVWGIGVDQDRGQVFISGRFQAVNGQVRGTTTAVDTETGASIEHAPHIRNAPSRPEMYDIEYVAGNSWSAGSQHVLQILDAATHELVAWNHAGNRCDAYCWASDGRGGDFQFVEKIGDFVYSGCHCNDKSPVTHYSSVTGQRTSNTVSMAYHLNGALVEDTEFDIGGNVDGGWSVASDTAGCLWLGGDIIDGGFYEPGGRVFARGFARFCNTDISVPQNVSVAAALASGIRIEWNDVSGASGYAIFRDGTYLGFSTEPFYVDTEVVQGREYEYTVAAENFQGTRSDESAAVQAVVGSVDNEPPSVPQNLSVLSIGGTEVFFEWEASTDNLGVQEYLIYRDGAYIGFVEGTVTQYADEGLENFARHSYEVRAVDFNGNRSDKSDPMPVRVGGVDVDAPTVPQNVSVASVTESTIEIEWDASVDNVDVYQYLIFRDGQYQDFVPADQTSYTDTGLVSFAEHRYQVRAVDEAGNRSEPSTTLVAEVGGVDDEAPSVPQNVTAVNVTDSSVDLVWDPSIDNIGVTSYLVYRDGAYIGWSLGASYSDVGLARGSYSYTVRAVDRSENRSERSAELPVVVGGLDVEAPSIPVNVTAVNVTDSSVDLVWDPSIDDVGVTSYLIYRDGAYIGWSQTESFSDVGLSRGTYKYAVRAVDAVDNRSERSGELEVLVGGLDVEAPSVPVNVAAVNVTDTSVELAWSPSVDNVGVSSYLIYRDGAYIGWSQTESFTDVGLSRGNYTYEIRAVDAVDNRSERSAGLTVTVGAPDVEAPSIPVNLTPTVNGSEVTLTWSPSTDNIGVTGYLVYRDGAYIGWSPTETYTDPGLANGTYAYAVRAVDAVDNRSERSGEIEVLVGPADVIPPSVPQNLAPGAVSAASVQLSWLPSSDNVAVQSYLVYRDGAYIGWTSTNTYFDESGLVVGQTYTYTVRAVDTSELRSDQSAPLAVTPQF